MKITEEQMQQVENLRDTLEEIQNMQADVAEWFENFGERLQAVENLRDTLEEIINMQANIADQ